MKIDGGVSFSVEIPSFKKDLVKTSTPVRILAQCKIAHYIEQFVAISRAHKSNLFEGILNPLKLRGLTNKPDDMEILLDNKKWVRKVHLFISIVFHL